MCAYMAAQKAAKASEREAGAGEGARQKNPSQIVARRAYELMKEAGMLTFESYNLPGALPDGREIDYARIVRTELDASLRRYGLKIVDVCTRCADEDIYLIAPSDIPDSDVEQYFHFMMRAYRYADVAEHWTNYVVEYLGRSLEQILQDIKEAWGL